ncbi:MAG: hypothetical protein H7A25_16085 [Leptospiraceae bacterium]|nr:hypothetical protein [Leptospiraceae bacterium]
MNLWQVLSTSGDNRILVKESGMNDVLVSPKPIENMVFRSSCTGSYLRNIDIEPLQEIWNQTNKNNFAERMDLLHRRMSKAFIVEKKTHIFTVSSGTDVEYIPLFLLKCIFADELRIVNIINGIGELGSNSNIAAAGFSFRPLTPSGKIIIKREKLFSNIKLIETYRNPVCAQDVIAKKFWYDPVIKELSNSNSIVLLHILEPSKFGYRMDVFTEIEELISLYPERLFIYVDACQTRTSPTEQ